MFVLANEKERNVVHVCSPGEKAKLVFSLVKCVYGCVSSTACVLVRETKKDESQR
jgi:hypothetical protein